MMRRILVVDDEPVVREVLTAMLAAQDFEVVAVGSGEEALATLRGPETPFCLVIVDMHMPGLSGVETCRAIRKLRSEIPLLLISGLNRETLDTEPLCELADGFIQKPFRVADLRQQVENVLDLEATPS
jgi:CheY-like chemotaxis protein